MDAVVIHPVAHGDGDDIVQAHLESRAYHHPWVTTFTDYAGFEVWFARAEAGEIAGFVARHSPSGGIVGLCTLSQIARGVFQSAYLGFHGMSAFARRGLMTHAVRLTARHAFGELGLHRIESNIQPDNLRSIALVQRVGFQKEGYSRRYLKIGGEWHDHERWALLADDPH